MEVVSFIKSPVTMIYIIGLISGCLDFLFYVKNKDRSILLLYNKQ